MKPPQGHRIEKLLAEWFEVRPIAKTARANGHHLTVLAKKFGSERKETCVEIARLDARLAKQPSSVRIAVDFAVGRIENGGIERRLGRAEQIAARERDGAGLKPPPAGRQCGTSAESVQARVQWSRQARKR